MRPRRFLCPTCEQIYRARIECCTARDGTGHPVAVTIPTDDCYLITTKGAQRWVPGSYVISEWEFWLDRADHRRRPAPRGHRDPTVEAIAG